MKIEQVRLTNYKSINDSGYISLHDNLNALVGKNNAGKTALIEGIYRFFQGTLNTPTHSGGSNSNGINNLEKDKAELELILKINEREQTSYLQGLDNKLWSNKFYIKLIGFGGVTYITQFSKCYSNKDNKPSYQEIYNFNLQPHDYYVYEYSKDKMKFIKTKPPNLHFLMNIWNALAKSIVFIKGNRVITEDMQSISDNETLNNLASNLHTVMHYLHNNREEIFDEIENKFISIFDDINKIRTTIVNSNKTNTRLDFKYNHNLISLNECGTGLSHILIMLCVIYSEENRIVLFDEPHSFLHPSAEKAIYDLAQNSNNQFIFTTHSPILINYHAEKEVYLLKKYYGKTNFSRLNKVEDAFRELGISNSDFALSDRVIFVEGLTEELVLPIIFDGFKIEQISLNLKIINLQGTGKEFKKKTSANKYAELHNKIFESLSPIPIPYCFIIDRDERTFEKVNELKSIYKEKLLVLERREIENYFLSTSAIVNTLISEGVNATESDINEIINKCLSDLENKNLFPKGCDNPANDVKGSALLEIIFSHYNLDYIKTKHGVLIVFYMIKNNPEDLKEIQDLFKPFLYDANNKDLY
ncbi:MAG: hypothetical protein JL56_04575 [Desulfotomaculum sp. BICA1-6]|nr:MAG: hypothetical protein JL56_04575 [Desulfotomaculum sp. BICA1-6]